MPGFRDSSVGSNQGATGKQIGAVPGNAIGQGKFMNPSKMPINSNYAAHRMSGGMPNDASTRVNDILLES